jgi:hypothetical protein
MPFARSLCSIPFCKLRITEPDGVSRGSSILGMRQLATSLLELTRETCPRPSLRHKVCRISSSNPRHGGRWTIIFRGGGCDSRPTALSDAESSSVEPWYYSTYRELPLRISTIPMLKSTEVVGNLLAACWLLVGCLSAACSEVPVWGILNCDRTRRMVQILIVWVGQVKNNYCTTTVSRFPSLSMLMLF